MVYYVLETAAYTYFKDANIPTQIPNLKVEQMNSRLPLY